MHRYGTQASFLFALPASVPEVGTWLLRELALYPYIAEHYNDLAGVYVIFWHIVSCVLICNRLTQLSLSYL